MKTYAEFIEEVTGRDPRRGMRAQIARERRRFRALSTKLARKIFKSKPVQKAKNFARRTVTGAILGGIFGE